MACSIRCNAGYLACSPDSLAICQQTVWDFETGNQQGFRVLNSPTAVSGKIVATTVTSNTGKYSLGVPLNASGATSRIFQVGPLVCGGTGKGAVAGKGLSVTGWMMLQPSGTPPALGKATYFGIRVYSESNPDTGTIVRFQPPAYGQWFKVSTPLPSGDVQLISYAVEGGIAADILTTDPPWIGAVYIDDVTIP
jgi:hypothetical protein